MTLTRTLRLVVLTLLAAALFAPVAGAQLVSDIGIVKTGPEQAPADSDVSYSISVTNIGPDASSTVTLDDPIPTGMTFVSELHDAAFTCTNPGVGNAGTVTCTTPAMLPDTSANFTFVFHIAPGTPDGTFFTNIASVSETGNLDPNNENDSSTAVTSTPPAASSDIFVLKTGPDSAAPDSDVSYTIVLGNSGPDTADTVSFTDALPGTMTFVSITQDSGPALTCTSASPVVCTGNSFPAGASAMLTLTGHIPAGTPSGTVFTNVVTTESSSDPNPENNESQTALTVSSVDVSVTKSGPASVDGGTDATYTVAVTNAGPDTASDVTLFDEFSGGATLVSFVQDTGPTATCAVPPTGSTQQIQCDWSLFAAGASAQFTVVLNSGASTSITNTATTTTRSFDTDSGNNSQTVNTAVVQIADLSVVKSGPASATAGTNATYTLSVANGGPSNATSVLLSDTLPAGTSFVSITQTAGPAFNCTGGAIVNCTIATFAPGAAATFDLVVAVAASAPAGGISNTATITSAATDNATGNNSSTANTTVITSADLSVTKSGPANVAPGANITYTLTAANAGPSDAANVQLSDSLPAGTTFVSMTQTTGPTFNCTGGATVTCTIASFAAGANATFDLVVSLASSAPAGGIANTAVITSTTTDGSTGNNSSTVNTTATPSADLSVTKSGPAAVAPGTDITYNLTVANAGPSDAANVQFSDPLPAGTTFASGTQDTGPAFNCTYPPVDGTGTITCTIASLTSGTSATFTFVLHVLPTATGTISNTATVSSTTSDPNPGNAASTSPAVVTPAATDVSITKTTNATRVPPSANVTYTIVATNNGPAVASNVVVTDVLPAGTTFVSANSTQGSCTGTSTVTCTIGALVAGDSATITLVIAMPPDYGPVSNTATVTSDNADTAPANNSSTAAIAVSTEIPSLSPLGLALLAFALGAAALLVMKR